MQDIQNCCFWISNKVWLMNFGIFIKLHWRYLPGWLSVLLLLINHPLELSETAEAIHGWFLALLACETEADLLWCLLATTEEWFNTTHKTFLLAVISTTTERNLTFFTAACLCYLDSSVLFAEFAKEFLCLWVMHHLTKGRPKPLQPLRTFTYFTWQFQKCRTPQQTVS